MHNTTRTQASRQRCVWFTHTNENADKAFKTVEQNSCLKTREKKQVFYYYLKQQSPWQRWGFNQQRKIGYCQKWKNLRGIWVPRNTIFLYFNFINSSSRRDYFSASGLFHWLRYPHTERQVEKQQQPTIKTGN